MNITKKLFTGSALQTLNLIFDIGIGFLMMPFLIHELSEKWYGLWLTVGSIIGFFGLLTLGLASAVQRYLSTENSDDKITDYNETLNSSLAVFFIAALLAMLLATTFAFLPSLLNIDAELSENFKYLMLLMGLNVALSFIVSPFRGVLNADYQFTSISSAELITLLSKAGLTVYFVLQGYGVIGVGISALLGNLLGKSILFFMALRLVKKIRFSRAYIKKHKLITLFKYSSKTFLAWLGDILRFSIDNLVVTAFVGLSAVTIYNLPLRLYNYASQFIITSLGVLQPYFSQKVGEKNNADIQRKFELAYGASFAFGAILAAGLFVFGYDFVNLWVGNYPEVEKLMYIFPVMLLLATSQNPCLLILYSHNKHQYYAYQNIGEGVFNAAISIIAVQYWGIVGVAIGSLLPMLVTKVFLQPRSTCNLIEFPLSKYYTQMLKCFIFVIVAGVLGKLFKTNIDSWFLLVVNVAIFSAIFIPCYWFIALNNNTKTFFITKLKRK